VVKLEGRIKDVLGSIPPMTLNGYKVSLMDLEERMKEVVSLIFY